VSTLFAGNYNVDKSHSNVGFKVKHMMISNVKGNFNDFKGSFEYDEKTKTLKSLNGEIQVASINTDDKKRDDHLRAPDLFDAKKFPLITFKLTKIEADEV
jgi:polyisoprenoid-binding protein YceI